MNTAQISRGFKQAILLSVGWHAVVFSLFSLSAGTKIYRQQYPGSFFWGGILGQYDLVCRLGARAFNARQSFLKNPDTVILDKQKVKLSIPPLYLKPQVSLVLYETKRIYKTETTVSLVIPPRRESTITFYPELPYHFLLYFKDRQAVHIELLFQVMSGVKANPIALKRKISSGNLEVDLLVMRYLSHYLFVQHVGFPRDAWTAVKIELSPKK